MVWICHLPTKQTSTHPATDFSSVPCKHGSGYRGTMTTVWRVCRDPCWSSLQPWSMFDVWNLLQKQMKNKQITTNDCKPDACVKIFFGQIKITKWLQSQFNRSSLATKTCFASARVKYSIFFPISYRGRDFYIVFNAMAPASTLQRQCVDMRDKNENL